MHRHPAAALAWVIGTFRAETRRGFWRRDAIGYGGGMTLIDQLRLLVEAAPAGANVTIRREWLAERLAALPTESAAVQVPLPLVAGALYTPAEAARATRRSRKHLRRHSIPTVRQAPGPVSRGGPPCLHRTQRHRAHRDRTFDPAACPESRTAARRPSECELQSPESVGSTLASGRRELISSARSRPS